jgi:DNA-binding response OmpR family regulator
MKKNVLIVDDDKDILEVLRYVSELLDANPVLKDYHITLPEIETLAPDLVILDHWLPVSSGGDLCRQIKDYQPTTNIPVMLVSAVVNLPELASFCRADDYIAKPFELEEMTRKMKIYLD